MIIRFAILILIIWIQRHTMPLSNFRRNNMKAKRIISILLAFLTVCTCIVVAGTSMASGVSVDVAESAYQDMLAQSSANNYGLASTVNEGTILQAWNWSFKNIEDNLELIASQGFTTIQVSPPNEIKTATKGAKVIQDDGKNGWWMFYQPAGFQINESTDNALGTKSEFVSMCSKAHSLGLKVIVDAVINHMGTNGYEGDDQSSDYDKNPINHVTPRAKEFEPEIYNNNLFHYPYKNMQYIESNASQYDSTYDLTRNCTSHLPDLKTEDTRVQKAIYDYMDELISSGADGFRFDAAKHIETPDDLQSLRSNFWPNTLGKVKQAHPENEVYAYGEILNTCGINRPFSMYTKLFDVTDSNSYWGIKDAATSGGSANATPYYPNSNFTSANTILWDESHDTYIDGATTSLTTVQRGKIWALVAGRAEITTVYFARPNDATNTNACKNITLGEVKLTSWSNKTTQAVNHFHNYFVGQSEYCTSNQSGTAYIERGTKGCIIINRGSTTTKSVTLTNHKLTAGTYIDAITGNTFTVTKTNIKGNVGNTGVACIYMDSVPTPGTEKPTEKPTVKPTEKPTQPPTQAPVYFTYKVGDADLDSKVTVIDATSIQKKLAQMLTFNEKQMISGDADEDKKISVLDATYIQKFLASITTPTRVNTEVTIEITPENPTGDVIPTSVTPTQPLPTQAPWTDPEPYTDPPEPPQPSIPTQEGCYTVIFSNNKGWGGTIHLYSWENDGDSVWPGEAMQYYQVNDFGEIQLFGFVPMEHSHFIINNGDGDGAVQTIDLDISGNTGVYLTDMNMEGKYEADFFDIG